MNASGKSFEADDLFLSDGKDRLEVGLHAFAVEEGLEVQITEVGGVEHWASLDDEGKMSNHNLKNVLWDVSGVEKNKCLKLVRYKNSGNCQPISPGDVLTSGFFGGFIRRWNKNVDLDL